MKSLLLVALVPVVGCGTIVNGHRQEIAITSVPIGAHCESEGKKFDTPAVVKLPRRRGHTIMCELDGRKGGSAVSRSGSAWVFGNLLLGGPVGLLVDWISGGLYRLSPESVTVAMGEKSEVPAAIK